MNDLIRSFSVFLMLFSAFESAFSQEVDLPESASREEAIEFVQSWAREGGRSELRRYVEVFAGAEPKDCGLHAVVDRRETANREAMETSLNCVMESTEKHVSSWAFKQIRGVDSAIYSGLVGTSEGVIFRFTFDSAPCGGPGCTGRFSIERCPVSVLITDNLGRSDFRCRQNTQESRD